jgi:thioredoxin 1
MNQPTNPERASPPLLLVVGLLLGGALVVFTAWDAIAQFFGKDPAGSIHVVKLTNDNWQKEVLESSIPVVVDFTAAWCGPCKALAPTIDKLADRYQGKIKVGKFDVGDNMFNNATKLAAEYGIKGVPHVLMFKGGEAHFQFEGGGSEAELAKAIDRLLQ